MIDRCYLEITNVCNLQCAFCPGHRRGARTLTDEEFERLTDRLAGNVRFLYFHLMGEPLLHPALPCFIARSKEKGFIPVLTTNGTLLDGTTASDIIGSAPYKVNISIHALEGNGFEHPDESLEQVIQFAKAASDNGIIVVLRLWNQGGLEQDNPMILKKLQDNFPIPWKERPDGYRLDSNIFLEFDRMFEWPDETAPVHEGSLFCHALRNQIGVLADGTVVPCCLDHNGSIPLGNLFDQPLDDILLSERARQIYEGFSRHQPAEELCRHCGYANVTKQFRRFVGSFGDRSH